MAAAAESSPPDEDSAGSDEPASTARPNADLENESEEAGAAAGGAVGGKSLEELAVRFSQATKELQAKLLLCVSSAFSVLHVKPLASAAVRPVLIKGEGFASCAAPHCMWGSYWC